MASVLSADRENDPDVLCHDRRQRRPARLAHPVPASRPARSASAASTASSSSCRRTRRLEESDLDLIVAGTRDAITMIEGFAREMPEDEMVQAIMFGHEQIVTDHRPDRGAAHARPAWAAKELPPPPPANPLDEIFKQQVSTTSSASASRPPARPTAPTQIKRAARNASSPSSLPEDGEAEVHARAGVQAPSTRSKSGSSAT